jgi:N-acetylmuramoyl-L-alanine amidase
MDLLSYFLKVVACSAAFYLLYYGLFSKLTFFSWNRWYLLFSLLTSLLIPVIHFQVEQPLPFHASIPAQITSLSGLNDAETDIKVPHLASNQADWEHILVLFYLFICSLMLFRVLIGLVSIISKAIKKGQKVDGYFLVANASKNNSSFFNLIFLNDDKIDASEKEQVLAHELQHMRLWHSIDNVFVQILKAFFWFNPFVYFISKELQKVHEFEVDRHLTGTYNASNYAGLLLRLVTPTGLGLVNQFSAYGVKSRIRMLFQAHSAAKYKLRYLWILPVLIVMGYQFSIQKTYAGTNIDPNFTLVLDAGHDGNKPGITCGSQYFEKDITLALAFQIKVVAEKRGIHTLLTRKGDEVVPFKERVSYKGDVFASIHVNAAPTGPLQQNANGIEINDNPSGKSPVLSAQIADQLKKSFRRLNGINTNDSTFAKPGVYVLRENPLPAVLIEFGYATNPKDLDYILNEHKRYELAEKFVDAIIAYKQHKR